MCQALGSPCVSLSLRLLRRVRAASPGDRQITGLGPPLPGLSRDLIQQLFLSEVSGLCSSAWLAAEFAKLGSVQRGSDRKAGAKHLDATICHCAR